MQTKNGNLLYAIRDVHPNGKGLVAIREIPKGTCILSEEPMITIPRDQQDSTQLRSFIRQQVAALSEEQRQAFLALHNIHRYSDAPEQYLGIIRTNALPIGPNGREGGIFIEACRINHACDNNSQKSWNENIKRHTVHAMRDIHEGEEITIYYLGVEGDRAARQTALQKGFGFICTCRLCSLPQEKSQESDKRLNKILQLEELIGGGGLQGILMNPQKALHYVDQQVCLYNEQGPDDNGLPRAFLDAAQICIANSDLARGRIFAERAISGWKILEGEDSPVIIEHGPLAQNPSKHALYGCSTKWKTAVDEVPQGLEHGDFEDWLWRREKPATQGQLADLRNRASFPGFTDLPDDREVDPAFPENIDVFAHRPKRHWCFLAEITDSFTLARLQMSVKDVNDKEIPLLFYTDGRGMEVGRSKIQKGYTVAVLYAQYHAFKYCEPGIRLEDPTMIKIFPVSLDKLLALSDEMQKFSTVHDGARMCHGCGKKGVSLKKCSKCSFFWYCGETCQRTGWIEKGHKAECKIIKDPNLRSLFVFRWDKFDKHVEFPLPV